jgi:hypothetical protein
MDQSVSERCPRPAAVLDPERAENDLASYLASEVGPAPAPARADGPVVGRLWGLDARGGPLVRFDSTRGEMAVPARSAVPLDSGAVGREVVLLFEEGDPSRPLIMGVLQTPRPEPVRTVIDGEKLVFTAEREIVLRCGEASITLTRAGKVLIEGAYVLTKAAGMNRIKGAAVQIN